MWVGAGVTAGLFFVGKLVIGVYLGSSELGAAYGAAGWVILILAWVYYSAQISSSAPSSPAPIAQVPHLIPLSPQGRGQGEGWSWLSDSATSPRSRPPPS